MISRLDLLFISFFFLIAFKTTCLYRHLPSYGPVESYKMKSKRKLIPFFLACQQLERILRKNLVSHGHPLVPAQKKDFSIHFLKEVYPPTNKSSENMTTTTISTFCRLSRSINRKKSLNTARRHLSLETYLSLLLRIQ